MYRGEARDGDKVARLAYGDELWASLSATEQSWATWTSRRGRGAADARLEKLLDRAFWTERLRAGGRFGHIVLELDDAR